MLERVIACDLGKREIRTGLCDMLRCGRRYSSAIKTVFLGEQVLSEV